MTDQEKWLLRKLADCWNDFLELKDRHPSDADDFMFHVHALQRIVLARLAERSDCEFSAWMKR